MASVDLQGVTKRYGSVLAADAVSFSAEAGSCVSMLGPSGCGKTTTLRMITGFEKTDAGEIRLDGARINEQKPWLRGLGIVFRNYALFPFLSVADNVAFGLKQRRVPRDEIATRVRQAPDLVGLPGREDRLPRQLSGGQQQRVALARALVIEPRVLLLDEPLSNLDAKLRAEMRFELKRIQRDSGVTSVFVTHDQEEALTLSDKIVVMNAGRVAAVGSPREIWSQPGTTFVADFLGVENIFEVQRSGTSLSLAGVPLAAPEAVQAGDAIGIRSTDIELSEGRAPAGTALAGTARQSSYRGAFFTHLVEVPALPRPMQVSSKHDLAPGSPVSLRLRPEALMSLREDRDRAA